MALAPDFQNTVQCGGRNAEACATAISFLRLRPLPRRRQSGHGCDAASSCAISIPVLVFGVDCIIQKMRQIQDWANRGKTGQINLTAVNRCLVGVGKFLAAPGGRNVCKRFFTGLLLSSAVCRVAMPVPVLRIK